MADWVVAVAEFQRQDRAAENLTGDGYTTYRPVFRERVVKRGVVQWATRYLLGHYIFVELTFDWFKYGAQLIATPFVRSVLTADERPLLARDAEVCRLRGTEVRGYVPVSKAAPMCGAPGRVTFGPFNKHFAQFEARDEDRLVDSILVHLFGTLTPMEVPVGAWEPA